MHLLEKFSLEIMLRLSHFLMKELNYMSRNQCQVSDLYAISLATDQKGNDIFASY